jgi:hypothetical protein
MKVYVAIPLLREFENINTLLEHIFKQDFKNFHVVFCVNNPAEWYDFVPSSKGMASQVNLESFQIKEEENSYQNSYEKDLKDNLKTLDYLRSLNNPLITIIDKSTRNNAYPLKKSGVGYARKVIMDKIASIADDNDIIISLDGDTIFSPQYFSSVLYQFENNKDAHAIAVPYYHRLEGTEEQKKAALRYEIYMRHYLIEMLKINNPYAFTALGAAIAVKVGSYKKSWWYNSIFVRRRFLSVAKNKETWEILLWCDEHVYPKARLSDRVGFGTGPAIDKGMGGDWDSYPIYKTEYFENVKKTFDLFPTLFEKDVDTPLTPFLMKQFNTDDVWSPLRKNYKQINQFVRACETKIDGLRILQYLKSSCDDFNYFPYHKENLYSVRDYLYKKENNLRIKFDVNFHSVFKW